MVVLEERPSTDQSWDINERSVLGLVVCCPRFVIPQVARWAEATRSMNKGHEHGS
jgi:hypothetical protein